MTKNRIEYIVANTMFNNLESAIIQNCIQNLISKVPGKGNFRFLFEKRVVCQNIIKKFIAN